MERIMPENFIEFYSLIKHLNSIIPKEKVKNILYAENRIFWIEKNRIKYKQIEEEEFIYFKDSNIKLIQDEELIEQIFNYSEYYALKYLDENKYIINELEDVIINQLSNLGILMESIEKYNLNILKCIYYINNLDKYKYILSDDDELVIFNNYTSHVSMAHMLGFNVLKVKSAGFVKQIENSEILFFGESLTLSKSTPIDTSHLKSKLLNSDFTFKYRRI